MMLRGLIVGIVLIIGISLVFSAVPFPHGFYGTVTYSNGSLVNSGSIVTEMNNLPTGQGSIINGQYSLVVQSTTNFGTIYFYYNNGTNNFLTTIPFGPTGNVTQLNFNVSSPIVTPTNITNITSNTTVTGDSNDDNDCEDSDHKSSFVNICEPNWECGGWSVFTSGVQTRNCIDTNNCDYKYNQPIEVVDCKSLEKQKVLVEEKHKINWKKPFLAFNLLLTFILLFLVLLIVRRRNQESDDYF
ncbi:Uncharacterised protein [uncultured archaeon]|nr:Uncharacterised protein [uncultured archaeon]